MRCVVRIIAHLPRADVFKERVVLQLIRVFFDPTPLSAGWQTIDEKLAPIGEIRAALHSVEMLAHIARTLATDLAALAQQAEACVRQARDGGLCLT